MENSTYWQHLCGPLGTGWAGGLAACVVTGLLACSSSIDLTQLPAGSGASRGGHDGPRQPGSASDPGAEASREDAGTTLWGRDAGTHDAGGSPRDASDAVSANPDAGGTPDGETDAGTGERPAADESSRPLVRDERFVDLAPELGERLPQFAPGRWNKVVLQDAPCRDGSPSALHVRYRNTSPNFFIFLEGGGACLNDFLCGITPRSVLQSQRSSNLVEGATGVAPVEQVPGSEGIFSDDPTNPVADWNAVYVPYCTGDVWGGTRANATFPPEQDTGIHTSGTHQFVGFSNTGKILGRVAATFRDADKALITGSSAGGIGALLNAHRLTDLLRKVAPQARAYVVSDSAVPFTDQYLAPCTQRYWRDLWGLNGAFPPDCEGCFAPDGGGIAVGLSDYFHAKFPDDGQVLGGLISSVDDEIIKLFYTQASPGCAPSVYGPGTYQAALEDFRDNVVDMGRFGTYFMPGAQHMHLWRPRFYQTNQTSMTIAEWLTRILNNEAVHVAPL